MDEIIQKLSQNKDISFGCFVGGKLTEFDDYKTAIDSCRIAFDDWKNNSNRYSILRRVSTLLKSKAASFTEVVSYGSYKCPSSIKDDLEYASLGFKYFSKLAKEDYSVKKNLVPRGILGGVVLEECAIFTILTWLTTAPLAAGNTVVLLVKPSYSVIALCFAIVLHEAGVPPGVLNVIPFVDEESFPIIACHIPRLIGIVPKTILSSDLHFSSVLVKKHCFFPMLVSKSADVDATIDIFINLTQNHEVLWYPNVIFVEEPIYEKFLKHLKFITQKYNSRIEKRYENDEKNSEVLNNFINEKKNECFEVIELIHRFCSCLIIVNHNTALNTPVLIDENKVVHRVISLLPIRTIEEGVSAINSNGDGLAVSYWCNDSIDAISIPFSLKCGTVWVNCANYFNPSIPFSSWNLLGYGTFSGKRALYENLVESTSDYEIQINLFYPAERNLIFSKKDISSVIKKSLEIQSQWSKMGTENQLTFIENIAMSMDKNWNTHFKIVLDQTTESQWKNSVNYLNFWASYAIEKTYQKIINASGCRVLCESEPVGVIGIMAGSATVDILLFLIGAALAYGNSVIVGISSDEKSSITGTELDNIFSAKAGLVNVIVNENNALWQQFIGNENIASVWLVKNYCNYFLKNYSFKNIISIEARTDMTVSAKFFEIYATKQKAVWLPCL